ncbi:hypothetical protein PVW48_13580 [Dinoroseobacter sp. PD6]|uniref:hypothetical protein n=1 Tax=Dinoroseobacter sp. PD6 TaxID=3028384 RepID=UPI00237AE949|nr:hypothetical protein [Dinoroseobacter sp. PD6]MDD9717785.1 hypothetical protein [Dinoroseobacter sp. PD6]
MSNPAPDVLAVIQAGRLSYEAVIFAASFRAANPEFAGRLVFAEPQPGPLWPGTDPRAEPEVRALLEAEFGAVILPFASEVFGASYPHGNKIEALKVLPEGAPFVFFDTDTLFTGPLSEVPFDFARPTASMRRTGTWPVIELYGPGYTEIWRALYDRFGLDFESSLDHSQPEEYWERYLYFNAGWFFGACPQVFHKQFLEIARSIRDDPPAALICQPLDPWLDQVALPLVIHGLGGARNTIPEGLLDGRVSCHYRLLPLLFARESDAVVETLMRVTAPNKVKKVLKGSEAAKRMIYQGRGAKARALFDRTALPPHERTIRNTLKRNRLWLR